MAIVQEGTAPVIPARARAIEPKPLNAGQVTSIAVSFLKSLGYKKGIRPQRVFIENQRFIVESEIGKKIHAKVQIDPRRGVISEYHIEKRSEEESTTLPVEPKTILLIFGISFVTFILFSILNLPGILSGLA